MTVTQLITSAFRLAASQYPELNEAWIKVSFQIGGQLPNSLLLPSVQRLGELDIVVRCMEDDFLRTQDSGGEDALFATTYQMTLSEIWVGASYEIFRLLKERKLAPDGDAFNGLAHQLRLLRIPLEKHEIAADWKLCEPLLTQRHPPREDEADIYQYSKDDPRRAHIMPSGLSRRGSAIWNVIDVVANRSYWVERRDLSERIIALWERPKSTDTANRAPHE